ncbi:hypothetical protein [Eubacterium oxidoreducens]|uniref:Bacterial Pleckstrin homology domain-containing protein n=1 Tax=Eubacterium oxidoreducens TaxID=1732 RepID=A0A1G6BXN1_EUBOX|nr:hypothetical protein [Eubacterium oxidoreducens]SDB25358.1 hypothetical protein SAMN02910417_01886 [Eubacterium oxidoreducens]
MRHPIYDGESENKKIMKTYQKMSLLLFVLILTLAVVIGLSKHSVNIISVTEANELVFSPENDEELSIYIPGITQIQLLDEFDYQSTEEIEGDGYIYGNAYSENYGDVKYYLYPSSKKYILIRYDEGYVVFNYLNTKNTEGFFTGLCELADEE